MGNYGRKIAVETCFLPVIGLNYPPLRRVLFSVTLKEIRALSPGAAIVL